MSIQSRLAGTILLAIPSVASLPALAATDSTTFKVLIEIIESCTISDITATDVDFGTYTRNETTDVDAQGTLNVNCPVGTTYNIGLDAGLNPVDTTAAAANRRMISGANLIPYGLYRDSARTLFWGDVIGTDTLSGTGTGTTVEVPVYGRTPSIDFAPGSYEDTVTATITY